MGESGASVKAAAVFVGRSRHFWVAALVGTALYVFGALGPLPANWIAVLIFLVYAKGVTRAAFCGENELPSLGSVLSGWSWRPDQTTLRPIAIPVSFRWYIATGLLLIPLRYVVLDILGLRGSTARVAALEQFHAGAAHSIAILVAIDAVVGFIIAIYMLVGAHVSGQLLRASAKPQ